MAGSLGNASVTLWKVVGGTSAGLLVREGRELSSKELPTRLSHGAVLRVVELSGQRLLFRKVSGSGPEQGWISITSKGKSLVEPLDTQAEHLNPQALTAEDADNIHQPEEKCLISAQGEQFTTSGAAVPATHWGMTRQQLKHFWVFCSTLDAWQQNPSMSVRDLDELVIRKHFKSGRSVAVTYNDASPLCINTLVSHCWDEDAHQFLADVCGMIYHAWWGNPDAAVVFICFLSQYQGTPEEIDLQVKQGGTDIHTNVFARVLRSVKSQEGKMLVIPCDAVACQEFGLYGRLWCTWEIHVALRFGIDIRLANCHYDPQDPEERLYTASGFPTVRRQHYLGTKGIVSSERGRCGKPSSMMNEDEKAIRTAICKEGGWATIDKSIAEYFKVFLSKTTFPGDDLMLDLK